MKPPGGASFTARQIFFDGRSAILAHPTSSLNSNGIAVLTTSALAIGTHNIYSGDSNFSPAALLC
jgi:hypothetical protein